MRGVVSGLVGGGRWEDRESRHGESYVVVLRVCRGVRRWSDMEAMAAVGFWMAGEWGRGVLCWWKSRVNNRRKMWKDMVKGVGWTRACFGIAEDLGVDSTHILMGL